MAAVQSFSTGDRATEREQALGRLAANAVVRYGEKFREEDLHLEHLSPEALRLIGSAASGAGWRCSRVIENLGRWLDATPIVARRRIPHAIRAHLIFLQLVGGDQFAYQWHSRWYENFWALKDRSLFIEYASGGKGAIRRAVSWSMLGNIGVGSEGVSRSFDSEVDGRRWGKFIEIVSSWGPKKDYYREAYSAFPTDDVRCDELYLVLQTINSRLFQSALDELGYDGALSNSAQAPRVLSNLPIDFEILPANEVDSSAPESVLVHTDELKWTPKIGQVDKLRIASTIKRNTEAINHVKETQNAYPGV